MRISAFSLLAALAVLGLLAAAGALYAMYAAGSAVHLAGSDCATCHLGGADGTAQQAGMLTASQEALCAKCHPASVQVSHPSGFPPKTRPPEAYPLDWKGDLTCSSCHQIHASGHGLIRGARTGKELCLACHLAEFFSAMRDGGASLMSGHLAKGGDGQARPLDAYSRKCMECHGANATPRLATAVDRNGVLRHASQKMNHPIGMNYQKAAKFGGYRARAVVEKKLLLPDGNVGCVSCHAGYQKEHGRLMLPMAGSGLCFECHSL